MMLKFKNVIRDKQKKEFFLLKLLFHKKCIKDPPVFHFIYKIQILILITHFLFKEK